MASDMTLQGSEAEMNRHIFTAVLHKEEDLYVAECPEVGTVSQGYTLEEAMINLQEATGLYLEEFALPEVSRSFLTTFEVATHAWPVPGVRAGSYSRIGAPWLRTN